MTSTAYNQATKILEEKKNLEEKLYQLTHSMSMNFNQSEEYQDISAKLFELGQEFASL